MNDDFDTALFEPEQVLPGQLSWGARCDSDILGPRALMLAILEDARLCLERGRRRRHPRTRELAAETESWVRSDSREWLFSFASICDVLGIDVDAARRRLLNSEPEGSRPRAARAQIAAPPTQNRAGARLLPQRRSVRESIPVVAARSGGRRPGYGPEAASELGKRARVGDSVA